MSLSFYAIQNRVIFLLLCQALSSPLRMEISNVFRKFIIQTVIYLVKKCWNFICMLIFQCNLRFFLKWHREITVKPSAWHNCHWHRIHNTFPSKPATEEISKRALYRWCFFIIPVHSDNQISQYKAICICSLIIYCNPDMIDFSRSFHFCQSYNCTWFYISQTRASFS